MAKARRSVLVDALSGHAGNVVFVDSKHGTLTRPRKKPHDPKTLAQVNMREALSQAAQTYRNLDPTTHARWQSYAATQTRIQPTTLAAYQPNAITLFTGLAGKRLQAGLPLPADFAPPEGPFLAPDVQVVATAAPDGLQLSANHPTPSSVWVELLVQPVAHALRRPIPVKMRTRAFLDFSTELVHVIPLAPGAYGMAIRFLSLPTGQTTPLVLLPNLELPASTL